MRVRFSVSTYSFWQFRHEEFRPLETCLDLAADMGFDGVEILHRQLERTDNAYLQSLKQRAFRLGLDLVGLSTHQTFLSPDPAKRRDNLQHTLRCLETAYALGIPTMRVQSGTWGTRKDFDDLMAHRGVEEPPPGHTDEDAFAWVHDAYAEILPVAERLGITLGFENHWGLGRTPEGLLRMVNALGSPFAAVTLDVGNFLEDPYDKIQACLPHACILHLKTYHGGGLWYTLDLDYPRIAQLARDANYTGYISLEFEGRDSPLTAIPQSLTLLRTTFT